MLDREAAALDRALTVADHAATESRWPMIDGLSVAVAGAVHPRVAAFTRELGADEGVARSGSAHVWFTGRTVPAAQAAMLNGMAIHANDFDDTHDAAIVHCMAAILPAAIAGAQLAGAGRTSIAAAVAAGTELACNLALTRAEYAGWHYTTLAGTLGAALAAAVAGGADADTRRAAVGNAYVFAAGNKQSVLDSSLMKRVMPGFAAQSGVLAFQAARSGLDGVDHWLTGDYGLFSLFWGGSARPDEVDGAASPRIGELSYKPYPACRFTHGAIEAAIELRAALASDIVAASAVDVRYPALTRFGIVCRPYERRGAAEMDAQFSTAYLVASALLFGEVSFASYTAERFADERIAALAGRTSVSCELAPGSEADLGPIEVSLAGQTRSVPIVLGSPARPLSAEDHRRKFATCLGRFAGGGGEQAAAVDDTRTWERLSSAVDASTAGDDAGLLDLLSTALDA